MGKGKFSKVQVGDKVIVSMPSVQVGMPNWHRTATVRGIDPDKGFFSVHFDDDNTPIVRMFRMKNGKHVTCRPEKGRVLSATEVYLMELPARITWLVKREKVVSVVSQVWKMDRDGHIVDNQNMLTLDRGVRVRMIKRVSPKVRRKKAGIFLVLTGGCIGSYFRSDLDEI